MEPNNYLSAPTCKPDLQVALPPAPAVEPAKEPTCPNCGKAGKHWIPPVMPPSDAAEPGHYTCDEPPPAPQEAVDWKAEVNAICQRVGGEYHPDADIRANVRNAVAYLGNEKVLAEAAAAREKALREQAEAATAAACAFFASDDGETPCKPEELLKKIWEWEHGYSRMFLWIEKRVETAEAEAKVLRDRVEELTDALVKTRDISLAIATGDPKKMKEAVAKALAHPAKGGNDAAAEAGKERADG